MTARTTPRPLQGIVLSPYLPSSFGSESTAGVRTVRGTARRGSVRLSGADHENPPAGGPAYGSVRPAHGWHAGAQPFRAPRAHPPADQAAPPWGCPRAAALRPLRA